MMLLKQEYNCIILLLFLAWMCADTQSRAEPYEAQWSLCRPRRWRQGSYSYPLCLVQDEDMAELACSRVKTGPGEWQAEFIVTTELRGRQRVKKNFHSLLCPRSSCVTCPLLCIDFPGPVQHFLTSENNLVWRQERIEESSWNVILRKVYV